MSELKFEPDYAVHPKETIREFVDLYEELLKCDVIVRTLNGEVYSFKEAEEMHDLMTDEDGNNYYSAQFLIDLQTNYYVKKSGIAESQLSTITAEYNELRRSIEDANCVNSQCSYWNKRMMFSCEREDEEFHATCKDKRIVPIPESKEEV